MVTGEIGLDRYLHGRSRDMQSGLQACLECHLACEMCADACLSQNDIKLLVPCIRLDRDCADACVLAVRVLARGGPLAAEACRMCAEVCDRCAEECERHAKHHEHCRVCAEACHRCAEECRRVAAIAA